MLFSKSSANFVTTFMGYKWSSHGANTGCQRRPERKLTLTFDLAIVCDLDTVAQRNCFGCMRCTMVQKKKSTHSERFSMRHCPLVMLSISCKLHHVWTKSTVRSYHLSGIPLKQKKKSLVSFNNVSVIMLLCHNCVCSLISLPPSARQW